MKGQRILVKSWGSSFVSSKLRRNTYKKKKSQTAFNYVIYSVRYYDDCFDENKRKKEKEKEEKINFTNNEKIIQLSSKEL